jgi:hypothetical protein
LRFSRFKRKTQGYGAVRYGKIRTRCKIWTPYRIRKNGLQPYPDNSKFNFLFKKKYLNENSLKNEKESCQNEIRALKEINLNEMKQDLEKHQSEFMQLVKGKSSAEKE